MTERNVLLENEIKANFILAKIMLLIFFIGILTVILTLTGFFVQPRFDYWLILTVLAELLFLAGAMLCKHYKGEPPWMKHVLIMILIISVFILNGIYTDSASLLLCIPVVLSIRYFSGKYSFYVALATFVAFFLSRLGRQCRDSGPECHGISAGNRDPHGAYDLAGGSGRGDSL